MPNEFDPVIDQWYSHRDKGEMFRVVAVDPTAGLVEIQNFDGDVEELEVDAWRDLEIDLAEAPENHSGPYDDIETDDLGYTETAMTPQDWRSPLDQLSPELPAGEEAWQESRAPDEADAENEGRPSEEHIEDDERTRNRLQ